MTAGQRDGIDKAVLREVDASLRYKKVRSMDYSPFLGPE